MKASEIFNTIKANLPNVIVDTPYSTVVILVVGLAIGAWLAS